MEWVAGHIDPAVPLFLSPSRLPCLPEAPDERDRPLCPGNCHVWFGWRYSTGHGGLNGRKVGGGGGGGGGGAVF